MEVEGVKKRFGLLLDYLSSLSFAASWTDLFTIISIKHLMKISVNIMLVLGKNAIFEINAIFNSVESKTGEALWLHEVINLANGG